MIIIVSPLFSRIPFLFSAGWVPSFHVVAQVADSPNPWSHHLSKSIACVGVARSLVLSSSLQPTTEYASDRATLHPMCAGLLPGFLGVYLITAWQMSMSLFLCPSLVRWLEVSSPWSSGIRNAYPRHRSILRARTLGYLQNANIGYTVQPLYAHNSTQLPL